MYTASQGIRAYVPPKSGRAVAGSVKSNVEFKRRANHTDAFGTSKYRLIDFVASGGTIDRDTVPVSVSIFIHASNIIQFKNTGEIGMMDANDKEAKIAGLLGGVLFLADLAFYSAVDDLDADMDSHYYLLTGTPSLNDTEWSTTKKSIEDKVLDIPVLRSLSNQSWKRYVTHRSSSNYIHEVYSDISKDTHIEQVIAVALECAGCVGGLPSKKTLESLLGELGFKEGEQDFFFKHLRTFLKPIQSLDHNVFVSYLKLLAEGYEGLRVALQRMTDRGTYLYNALSNGILHGKFYGTLAELVHAKATSPYGDKDLLTHLKSLPAKLKQYDMKAANDLVLQVSNKFRTTAIAIACSEIVPTDASAKRKRKRGEHFKALDMMGELSQAEILAVKTSQNLNAMELGASDSRPKSTYDYYENGVLHAMTDEFNKWKESQAKAALMIQQNAAGRISTPSAPSELPMITW